MKIDVTHIARLASLEIDAEEISKFEKQLSEVLSFIGKLNEVDTANITPTSQVTGLENIMRDDKIAESLDPSLAISSAGDKYNNLVMVEGIMEND